MKEIELLFKGNVIRKLFSNDKSCERTYKNITFVTEELQKLVPQIIKLEESLINLPEIEPKEKHDIFDFIIDICKQENCTKEEFNLTMHRFEPMMKRIKVLSELKINTLVYN